MDLVLLCLLIPFCGVDLAPVPGESPFAELNPLAAFAIVQISSLLHGVIPWLRYRQFLFMGGLAANSDGNEIWSLLCSRGKRRALRNALAGLAMIETDEASRDWAMVRNVGVARAHGDLAQAMATEDVERAVVVAEWILARSDLAKAEEVYVLDLSSVAGLQGGQV